MGERVAGVGEAGMDDGVVLGEVAECEGVADCGCDCGWVEGEFCVGTDGDGVVCCESEREEGEEGDREGGMRGIDLS